MELGKEGDDDCAAIDAVILALDEGNVVDCVPERRDRVEIEILLPQEAGLDHILTRQPLELAFGQLSISLSKSGSLICISIIAHARSKSAEICAPISRVARRDEVQRLIARCPVACAFV